MSGHPIAAVAPSGRAIGVLSLGILLPLAFISDVFPFGGAMPEWLTTIASIVPLVHFVHGLAGALDPAEAKLEWSEPRSDGRLARRRHARGGALVPLGAEALRAWPVADRSTSRPSRPGSPGSPHSGRARSRSQACWS